MNLKDLFEKAENGVLTYDQFVALATNEKAKFVDLSEGNYVDKQKYTDDISARDTRISELDDSLKNRDTDLANLRTQLDTAGTDATKLSELTDSFGELQKKYDKETKAYQKQLKDQAYKFAVTDIANKQNFTSTAARRDFINTMLAKNLQMENDTIIGATDFIAAYTKDNADAFKAAEETPPARTQPHFVDSTSTQSAQTGPTSPFNFNFTGVRPHKE